MLSASFPIQDSIKEPTESVSSQDVWLFTPKSLYQLHAFECTLGGDIDGSKGVAAASKEAACSARSSQPNKCYLYHHNHGHDMKECIQL